MMIHRLLSVWWLSVNCWRYFMGIRLSIPTNRDRIWFSIPLQCVRERAHIRYLKLALVVLLTYQEAIDVEVQLTARRSNGFDGFTRCILEIFSLMTTDSCNINIFLIGIEECCS